MKPQAFTVRYPQRVRALITRAKIGPAFDHNTDNAPDNFIIVRALWDTGADGTVISKRIAADCNLEPTGVIQMQGVNGIRATSTYVVSLALENGVGFSQLRVSQGDLGDNIDLLIGMDVITEGDFAISHFRGTTAMSFRYPSSEDICFVQAAWPKNIGRNDPCPCGSGKKYKQCHGRRA